MIAESCYLADDKMVAGCLCGPCTSAIICSSTARSCFSQQKIQRGAQHPISSFEFLTIGAQIMRMAAAIARSA